MNEIKKTQTKQRWVTPTATSWGSTSDALNGNGANIDGANGSR